MTDIDFDLDFAVEIGEQEEESQEQSYGSLLMSDNQELERGDIVQLNQADQI